MKDIETESLPWHRQVLYGLTNWALLAAGLANLAVGTWAAVHEAAAVAATSLTAGLVLLFAATIDRFESLKGLGIEAKTRQLDKKIIQAADALRRLREMTEITGAALIDLNSKTGRLDSAPGPRESIALAERVRQIMTSLGSDPSTIAAALRPWARILCFDMAHAQSKELYTLVQTRMRALEAERHRVPQPIPANDVEFARLSAQITTLSEFQNSRLMKLHLIELEDYPDKFMTLFNDAPYISSAEIEPLRANAVRFVPGMHSLRKTQALPEAELWISELERASEG